MAEYDPMEELGLIHDKQLICNNQGFLQMNNSTRDVCNRFIRDGDKFYDMLSRYEDVISYVLNREGDKAGHMTKFAAPFLKAFGTTDYGMYQCCKESMKLMPEAKRAIKYLSNLLPTFLSTSSYEHNIMALCDELELPITMCDYAQLQLDSYDTHRSEARAMRDLASKITSLRLPRMQYELNVPISLPDDEVQMIDLLDDVFLKKVPDMEFGAILRDTKSIGTNEKAYALLDIRKRTMVDFDGTAYIGGDLIDYQAMDLVRDGGGLSMAFNGSEFAVHGCNVAVLSRDCTVAAVLVQEFYNEGIEAVFDLVSNWDRDALKKRECPDRHLMDAMLEANPRKLPEVFVINKNNVAEIAKKSDKYRKKLALTY